MKRPSLGMAPIKTEVSVEAYAEIMRLEKTIERLREALRKISNMGQTNVPDHWDFRVKAREIARAALGEKE